MEIPVPHITYVTRQLGSAVCGAQFGTTEIWLHTAKCSAAGTSEHLLLSAGDHVRPQDCSSRGMAGGELDE
jgi:hypothetical protein